MWIWGVPMVTRGFSIVAALVDGHYTQMCASGRASHEGPDDAGLACTVFHKALRTPAGNTDRPKDRD